MPRNLSNLGKASLFPYPVFYLLRSLSARMKIENAGIITRKRILGIFLGSKGNSYYSLSAKEVCGACFQCLAMKSSTAVSLGKVNEPSNGMYIALPNLIPPILTLQNERHLELFCVPKVKRTNMLQYKH